MQITANWISNVKVQNSRLNKHETFQNYASHYNPYFTKNWKIKLLT